MSVKQKWGYDCPSAEVRMAGSRTTSFCHLHAFQMSTRAWKMEAKKKLGESALKHIQAGWRLLPVLAFTFRCPSAAAASSAASTTNHHVVTPLPGLDQGSGVNKSLLFKVAYANSTHISKQIRKWLYRSLLAYLERRAFWQKKQSAFPTKMSQQKQESGQAGTKLKLIPFCTLT